MNGDEKVKCEECLEEFDADELNEGLCDDCAADFEDDTEEDESD